MSDMMVEDWVLQNLGEGRLWYLKRLSANDTLETGAHQAGPYLPKSAFFAIFPELQNPSHVNPDARFRLAIDSHSQEVKARAVWYNNHFRGRSRNETRITNLGGVASPLLNPESTGALAVFVFSLIPHASGRECRVWVCRTVEDEDFIENLSGPVEPGRPRTWLPNGTGGVQLTLTEPNRPCWLTSEQIPPDWFTRFPSGEEILRKTLELRPGRNGAPDVRIIQRRDCEYELFRSVESAIELPRVRAGHLGIEEFIAHAQTILQRRKSRSGRSLELHLKQIFIEESLTEGVKFSHQPESESGKKPDFLFPSGQVYGDPSFPKDRLRMLAVKTSCKDRWRQILNEADRVSRKHLFTLQEGVSTPQFKEMDEAGVILVVPKSHIVKFPEAIRPRLLSLSDFVAEVASLVP